MRLETILVTPDLAVMFLKNNFSNRKLRASHVETFIRELRQGTFRTTHQGIAISKSGKLLDGQHRLTAIERSGIAATMVVAWDCESELAIDWPVDFGIARTASDVLGFTRDNAAVVDACLRIYTNHARRFSTHERTVTHAIVGQLISRLESFCTYKKRLLSRTAIRVPAMLRLIDDPEYAGLQYNAFVHQDHKTMSNAVAAFFKKLTDVGVRAVPSETMLMARAWVAFDPAKSANCKQQIAEAGPHIAEMRDVLGRLGMNVLSHESDETE